MRLAKISALLLAVLLLLPACAKTTEVPANKETNDIQTDVKADSVPEILLSDEGINVSGDSDAVYTANDVIYYENGHDFTYGEGTEKDAHTKEEADAHTVIHITKAGEYSLSGKLERGQIAVDLGEDAKEDPEAVVTLILNEVDITCEVAPAVIFYNVYECSSTDTETATKDIDTVAAGANVIIADDTVNYVNGSYVERIYKPDSVVLSEDGTEVEDAKKLHKYDGAFYSKMSMNINGGEKGTGILNIKAENEGLDSELHLTVNGGNINIFSGNDGINTNEDGVSVTTVNGGALNIKVTGETGEGDGIDSNGWLVINGGTVTAAACSDSADAGIDSDMGIHINGGTVIASGNMLDRIEEGGQNYAVFNFSEKQDSTSALTFKNSDGNAVMEYTPENSFSILIFSAPELEEGIYTLWNADKQLAGQSGGYMGGPGMMPGGERPEMPDGERPEMPDGERPEMPDGERPTIPDDQRPVMPEPADRPEPPADFVPPENGEFPESAEEFEFPEGNKSPNKQEAFHDPWMRPGGVETAPTELSSDFEIKAGGNMFSGVTYRE